MTAYLSVFEKNTIFPQKIGENRRKIVIIASTQAKLAPNLFETTFLGLSCQCGSFVRK
jgi:hypothetical protein